METLSAVREFSSAILDWAMVAGLFAAQAFVAMGGAQQYLS